LGRTRYVAPRGSDADPCTQPAPCKSLERAYQAARPGDVVEIAGGTYPTRQRIDADPTKAAGAKIIFRPAVGAHPNFSDRTDVYASNIELRDLTIYLPYLQQANNVVLRNLDMSFFFIAGGSHIRVLGGDVGPANDIYSSVGYNASKVAIDGVYFHDYTRDPGVHMECLHIHGGSGIVVRNSRFQRCAVMDIYITWWSGQQTHDITIENNFLGAPPDSWYAIQAHAVPNVDIRYNSALAPFLFYTGKDWAGPVHVTANVAPLSPQGCNGSGEVIYAYNVWTGVACSATDRIAPTGFVNPGRLDLHLRPTAAAVRHGEPSNRPQSDIDGDARPRGRRPDAGADERTLTASARSHRAGPR
jgi:hypothetical protein